MAKLKTLIFILAFTSLMTQFMPVASAAPYSPLGAVELLKKVDSYRNFKDQGFSFDLQLTSKSKRNNKEKVNEFVMHAKVLSSKVSLISYLEPRKEKGKAILMNGRNLWFITKTSRKPIRITPQQRLVGEASNGDVASTDFSGDYDPTIEKWETLEGTRYAVLRLTAKEDSIAAYKSVLLWVGVDNDYKPKQAEFYSGTGKHLKTAYYKRFEPLANFDNKMQMVEIEIVNALRTHKRTTMKYSNFKLEQLNLAQFQPARIKAMVRKL